MGLSRSVAQLCARLMAYTRMHVGSVGPTSEPKPLGGCSPTLADSGYAVAIADMRQNVLSELGGLHNERGNLESAAAEALLGAWAGFEQQRPPLAQWTLFRQTLQHAEQAYQQAAEHYTALDESLWGLKLSANINATFIRLNIVRVHKMLVKTLLNLEPSRPRRQNRTLEPINKCNSQRNQAFSRSADRRFPTWSKMQLLRYTYEYCTPRTLEISSSIRSVYVYVLEMSTGRTFTARPV